MFSYIARLFFIFSLSSTLLYAQDLSSLQNMNISKAQIKKSLQELHKMGRLTDKQLEDATKELDGMSDKKMNALIVKGQKMGAEMSKQAGGPEALAKKLKEMEKQLGKKSE